MDNFDLKKYLAEGKLNENELSKLEKYPELKEVRDHALRLAEILDGMDTNPENFPTHKFLFPTYNKLVRAMSKFDRRFKGSM